MSRLLHLALQADLDACAALDHYRPAAFDAEGFVHCCRETQLAGVLERYFRDRAGVVLLEIDPGRLTVPVVEEDTTGRGEVFPHIYGPIPWAAVLRREPLPSP
jgi:uncharacterized protein (DUF952 family)